VQTGYRVVVDVDLEEFFDRVNHDIKVVHYRPCWRMCCWMK